MKNAILFFGVSLFLLCCSNNRRAVKISQGKNANGYVVFVGDESIIFVPNIKPQSQIPFDDLEKEISFDIKGYVVDELNNLKKIGSSYKVIINLIDKNGAEEPTEYPLTIIPVQLIYETKASPKIDSSGVPFKYEGKPYFINYVFNYDLTVLKIKPYFKKDMRRLKRENL